MREPGSHAAGPCKARHDPKLDRGRHLNEDDRDRGGRPLQVEDGRPVAYQQIGRQPDQLGGVLAGASGLATKPAHVESNVVPFDPAELSQPLRQCRDSGSSLLVRIHGHEHPDAPDTAPFLRARSPRPRRRAAEQRDELAPFYLIDWHQGPPSVMNSRRHYRSPRRRRGSTVLRVARPGPRSPLLSLCHPPANGRGTYSLVADTASSDHPRFCSRINASSRSTTAAGCSSCTQWPAPSTRWKPSMRMKALLRIASAAPGNWYVPQSLAPLTYTDGTPMARPEKVSISAALLPSVPRRTR